MQKYLSEERVTAIFKSFDVDNTDKISKQNIIDAFSKFGRTLSIEDLEQIIKAHDTDGDGEISLEEFKNMMHFEKRTKGYIYGYY
jgi:calmodulin